MKACALVWVCVVLAGCVGEGRSVLRTESDSSGLGIVSLTAVPPATAPEYQWELVLRRSIPTGAVGLEESPLLYDPRSITRLPDGTLVVADAGDPPLAVIPAEADTVATGFARLGRGPGEIYGGYPVLWPGTGGSFWVADRGNARVSRFDTTGALLDELRLPAGGASTNLELVVQEATGRLFAQQYAFPDPERPVPEHSVVELDLVNEGIRAVVQLPQEGDPPGLMVLWNARALWTVLGNGTVVTGHADSAAFSIWNTAGELLRRIILDLPPRPVSEADRARILQELDRSPASVRFTEFFPYSDIYHPFSDSVFALRHTWVSHAAGDEVTEGRFVWRLLSASGFYMGTINFPPGFEPEWTDGEYLVGVQRDSLGVATIQEHQLVPPIALGR